MHDQIIMHAFGLWEDVEKIHTATRKTFNLLTTALSFSAVLFSEEVSFSAVMTYIAAFDPRDPG